ncbi:epoxide hydrolase N-terminal domain-containing protein [Streptomyces sp. NPDC091272]|uniref:epoxide hydrolase N-terminal domain-containing protein n=1 Tax=Streptomyces sp. NPDC091272 TaxID=3365981 RepID=UPI00380C72A9
MPRCIRSGWGTRQPWLRQLVEYWLHGYDWRRTEAELNALARTRAPRTGADHPSAPRTRTPSVPPPALVHQVYI